MEWKANIYDIKHLKRHSRTWNHLTFFFRIHIRILQIQKTDPGMPSPGPVHLKCQWESKHPPTSSAKLSSPPIGPSPSSTLMANPLVLPSPHGGSAWFNLHVWWDSQRNCRRSCQFFSFFSLRNPAFVDHVWGKTTNFPSRFRFTKGQLVQRKSMWNHTPIVCQYS